MEIDVATDSEESAGHTGRGVRVSVRVSVRVRVRVRVSVRVRVQLRVEAKGTLLG